MPGFLVALILLASLLLVHFSVRAHPAPVARPLDVNEGLPLPEVAQASTVFSLTALFGAYLGIYLLLGVPALAGLAVGSALGLLLIRRWVRASESQTFEQFLGVVFAKSRSSNATVLAFSLAGLQLAYATSELLILREISRALLGVRSDQATLLALSVGVLGYFYVLIGGYGALFRTDVLQFVLVVVMAVAIVSSLPSDLVSVGWQGRLTPRPGYWVLPEGMPDFLRYAYHFFIAAVMGVGFLAASPDAWKRVFLVTRRKSPSAFAIFVVVGLAPFFVLLPLALAIPPLPDGALTVHVLFAGLLTSDVVFVAAALGLIASCLSAFNSALLLSVHVVIMWRRPRAAKITEVPTFHWVISSGLLAIFFLFEPLKSLGNPYILANLLLGAYAIIAGVLAGTEGRISVMRDNSLLWVIVVGGISWFLYFLWEVDLPRVPTTYEINTVPSAVLLFFVTLAVCRLTNNRQRLHVLSQ